MRKSAQIFSSHVLYSKLSKLKIIPSRRNLLWVVVVTMVVAAADLAAIAAGLSFFCFCAAVAAVKAAVAAAWIAAGSSFCFCAAAAIIEIAVAARRITAVVVANRPIRL